MSEVNWTTQDRAVRRFRGMALSTVAVIYLLILVGGIVRATGAGMGCPDWPTCFGRWVPPISESELPADYQRIYADRGYADTTFNVKKTWTEYLNRLLGVFTGFLIFLTLLFAIPLRAVDRQVLHLAVFGFLLVAFQGWLGSQVVASNLHPVMITVHMLVAQVIVVVLIYALARSQRMRLSAIPVQTLPNWTGYLIGGVIAISLLQLVIGTQVREAVDIISKSTNNTDRHLWIENLPWVFALHRYLAWPIAIANAFLIARIWQQVPGLNALKLGALGLAIVLLGTMVMGMSMQRLNLPMYAQPLHLWFASLIVGLQMFIFIIWRFTQHTETDRISVQQIHKAYEQ